MSGGRDRGRKALLGGDSQSGIRCMRGKYGRDIGKYFVKWLE